MNNSSTVINFSYFQEQTVTKVNTDNTLPFSLGFSKGGLVAECPWRLKTNAAFCLVKRTGNRYILPSSVSKSKHCCLASTLSLYSGMKISVYFELHFLMGMR
ncbi:hypothetical protein AAAC51_08685 [Priestia megaterium]